MCLICYGVTAGATGLGGLVAPPVADLPTAPMAPPATVRSIDQVASAPVQLQRPTQTPKIAGTNCPKAGLKRDATEATFVCKKKGKKLVWVERKPVSTTPAVTNNPPQVSTPKSDLSPATALAPISDCKLRATGADGSQGLIRTGFPRNADASLPVGDVVVQVIPVDYPNLSGQRPLQDVLRPISDGVTDYYKKVSGGRLNLVWRLPAFAVRMPNPVEHYRLGISERTNGFSFIQDVLDASDHAIDFSGASFVVVLNPETATPSQIGGMAAQQMVRGFRFRTNEGEIFRATGTSSNTTGSSGWVIIAHELAHSLGLPDTYLFSGQPSNQQALVGWFDLMGHNFLGGALELFAWHKWQLDFIGDSQVYCLKEPTVNRFWLSPISAGSNKPEMVVLPMSDTTAIVVESRRKERFDQGAALGPVSDGLLVYQVDTSQATGRGPIRVVRKPGSSQRMFLDNLLGVGEQLQAGPFIIKNVENGTWGNVVEVTRTP